MAEKVRKITKVQRFEDIKAMLSDEVVQYGTDKNTAIEFIDHEMELLSRKNSSGEKKPTVIQLENESHKERIKDYLRNCSEGKTVTQVLKAIPEFTDFSNQKVARLLKDMLEIGVVSKEVVKGKSLFSLA